jgi:hypothetical protein
MPRRTDGALHSRGSNTADQRPARAALSLSLAIDGEDTLSLPINHDIVGMNAEAGAFAR